MRRRLSATLPALSLVLGAATCVMWVRSQRVIESYLVELGEIRQVGIASADGAFWLSAAAVRPKPGVEAGFVETAGYHRASTADVDIRAYAGPGWLGFGWMSYEARFGSFRLLGIPYWLIAALLGAPGIGWWVGRRRRRWGPGLCRTCGYDLRATPGRCPECGAVAASAA